MKMCSWFFKNAVGYRYSEIGCSKKRKAIPENIHPEILQNTHTFLKHLSKGYICFGFLSN